MFCSFCGSTIEEDSRFCSECGKKIQDNSNLTPTPCNSQPGLEKVSKKTKTQEFSCSCDLFPILISNLEQWLHSQKFTAQKLPTKDGRTLMQVRKGGFLKKGMGMAPSVNIWLEHEDNLLRVEIGNDRWLSRGAVGGASAYATGAAVCAVGAVAAAPLAVTVGIGVYLQKQLPNKIFNFIKNTCDTYDRQS